MKNHRRLIIFIFLTVVIIGISAAAAFLLTRQEIASNTEKSGSSGVPQKFPAERKADTADKLAYEGDVAAGVTQLDDAIKGTTDVQDQFIYYSRKATLLLNHRDLAGALTAALKAHELNKTSDSAAFVGQIAREKADKQLALEYYKKAITLIDRTDPFAEEDKTYYESVVKELETTGV